jgi:hypothetical protein
VAGAARREPRGADPGADRGAESRRQTLQTVASRWSRILVNCHHLTVARCPDDADGFTGITIVYTKLNLEAGRVAVGHRRGEETGSFD